MSVMAKKTDGNKSRNVRKYEFEPGYGAVNDGHLVRRIRATSDIPGTDVKAGTSSPNPTCHTAGRAGFTTTRSSAAART